MRLNHSSQRHKLLRALAAVFTTQVALLATWAEASSSTYYIEGIGYREQALQQPKTTFFQSEDANGVLYASFNGGTNIFIKGPELNENPQSNVVYFQSVEFNNIMIPGTPLDADDAFNSNPMLGFITYRVPSPHELFGVQPSNFDMYEALHFYISVKAPDVFGEEQHMQCKSLGRCQIRFHRSYTPVVFYLNPPVIYYEAVTEMWFDPMYTLSKVQNLQQDEMIFVNTEIGGSKLDYEFQVDFDTSFWYWTDNKVLGTAGDMPVGHDKDIKMLWEVGYAFVAEQEATHCTFDMKRCYKAMAVPSISSISASQGYTSGGQNLTIYGHGFSGPNVTVKVAGYDCQVLQNQDSSISCLVQPTLNPTPENMTYVGAHGLKTLFYNDSSLDYWQSYEGKQHTKQLSTQFEIPTNQGDKLGYNMTGWFIAPQTGSYRFHLTCDDACKVKMGLNTSDPLVLTKIAERTSWSGRRWHFRPGATVSEWYNFTKGEKYYIEGKHGDSWGGDNFQVGVEINQTDSPAEDYVRDHHHAIKEVQYIHAGVQDMKKETFRITVKNVGADGFYILSFQNPKDLTWWNSDQLQLTINQWQMRNRIFRFFWNNYRSDVDVNITKYDANDTETTVNADAVTYVYHVKVRKLLDAPAAANIKVIKSTTATITVDQSSTVQAGDGPLSGSYRIVCPGPPGNDVAAYPITTNDIPLSHSAYWIGREIEKNCTDSRYKIEVFNAPGQEYNVNGLNYMVRFIGSNGPKSQMRIISGVDTPLTHSKLQFNQSKIVNATNDLIFYEAIPFEMLRTFETNPQVEVQVGDYPAVCKNINCDYNFVIPEGEVTGFTYTAGTRELQLTGLDLPANASLIRMIEFAHSKCTVTSVSNSTIVCTLDYEPVCGDHLPYLYSIYGLVNQTAGLTPETITCTATSVIPTTQLNLLGGDNLTLSGTQFPWNLETSTVEIKFNDAQETQCIPQTSTSTSLVCLTEAFDVDTSAGQSYGLVIVINNQTVTNTLSLATMPNTKSGLVLNPDSANPTLKTKINITLESDFPYTLDRAHFSVNATNISNPSYFRQMNVIGVDDATKSLLCMFGGAWSGLYSVTIRHRDFGLLHTKGLLFTVGSNVTDYSPKSGSIYGGTLLTITGTNFGSEFTDNPVQVFSGAGASVHCYLTEIQQTQIKCRVGATNQTAGDTGKMIVFLKTSEEASCKPTEKCDWTYTGIIPEVSSIDPIWDLTSHKWQVVVNGTGFTGTTDTTEFSVGGKVQRTVSVNSTHAVFEIGEITSNVLSNMKLYFDIGTPKGHDTVIDGKEIELVPKLVSLSIQKGSLGGSLIHATVEGYGPISASETWANAGIDLTVNSTGGSLCASVVVKANGIVECQTNPIAVAARSMISLHLNKYGHAYSCNGADRSLCEYETSSTEFPAVTAIDNTVGNQIVFTGTGFFTSNYLARASYGGSHADSVTIDSATQATATWNFGLPPLNEAIVPQLWFEFQGTPVTLHYANIADNTITLTKQLGTPTGPASLSCSFAGGCNLEIQAEGLSSILSNDTVNNYITVCDTKCEFLNDSSDSSKSVCMLPKISTVYSNQQFSIETQQDDLRFRRVFGTLNDVEKVFDHTLTQTPTVSGGISECFVGGSFKENHVGMLSQFKYFMKELNNKAVYVDKLTLQGSADNTTWTDLDVADENIHEGWNYISWNDTATQPKYRFYRLYSNQNQGCDVNEIKMIGLETVDDSNTDYVCQVAIEKDGIILANVTETVTYQGSLTPALDAVNPRYGPVTGGTSVTFTGTNFDTDTSKFKIVIDKRSCTVTAATTTSVTCTTDHRPGLIEPSLEISIDGKGYVSNKGNLFRYVSFWSDDTTWGGEFAPMEGESVFVPKGLNLYVDVDSTPVLNLVMVEGALIFAPHTDPNHERYFDAHYIFLNNAYMEVGTEEFTYTSKLTITMHGNITSPYLPIFGNKCIAVKHSNIEMHGIPRNPTWTVLNETVEPGATVIKLSQPVDWVAGEEIAIASTSFNGREGEKRFIKSIDKSNPDIPVITLNEPLDAKHFAMIQHYGDDFIDMRAEVGLLTRNIKYRGNPADSFPNQYGAVIFLHSEGDDSLVARLEYIELNEVGQAFKVGRYAVHFHMIGAVHKSYCKGFGTHVSFNRAFTLHGTHYMRLINNVAFDVKGHVIFIEDAVEKKNHIQGNLIMKVKRSWSLLNTDQTPACFWITNPDNNFVDNHCGGSDRYGYWYDLQIHAIGPHANTNVCPENERVGEFRNNSAHSCGRYGLRIFHNMVPRKYPCKPIIYDHTNTTDPYWQNPVITANFYDLTSWKNGRNGAIAEKVGDIRWHNFKVADNKLAGMEFSVVDYSMGDNATRINGGLIVGRTNNSELALEISEPYGIIGPRTENFRVDGVKFFNFDWNEAAALSSCSHCFHPQATDSGARTIRFSNLSFDSSVKRIANYQLPWKVIFLDEDGTLTGKGPGSWATPYYPHHNQTGCEHNASYYGGVFCDNTVQVRRIAFHGAKPAALFKGMGFKVLRYDDDQVAEYGNKTEYLADKSQYSTILFKEKLRPWNGWATPFVTGHKYKIHFGMTGLDYEELLIDASERWEETDKSIYLVHNWTDVRQAIEFKIGVNSQKNGWLMENNTIDPDPNNWVFGQHVVYNETDVRETHIIINGKNQSGDPHEEQTIYQKGFRCVGQCGEQVIEVPLEDRFRYWNNASDWPSGKVPEEDEDVHIESGWQMVFNMNPSPKYKLIRVNGKLTFDNTTDTHLKCKHLFIRAGELHIGSEEYPYEKNARITLYGEKQMETIVYDNAIEAGNKLIANVNVMRMYGKRRGWKMSRLQRPAQRGESEIWIEPGLEIYPGDRLAVLTTSYESHHNDDVFVSTYDTNTGRVGITRQLDYYHWGRDTSTASQYNGLDVRGEVILLTRNIVIDAEDIESWGGQIVTSDTQELYGTEMVSRTGTTIMDSVEIFNCSQIDTFKAAIRFESASTLPSSITNSAIHNGYAWGLHITGSANINVTDNVFFNFRPIGLGVQKSRNCTIDNNVVSGIIERTTIETLDQVVDKAGGISICAYSGDDDPCTDIKVRNNLVSGSVYAGFVMPGHDCGDTSGRYSGNVAHSVHGFKSGLGLFFLNSVSQPDCTEFSDFKAYKCYYQGAFGWPNSKRVIMRDMVMIDNKEGVGSNIVNKGNEFDLDVVSITMKNMHVYGESEIPDCPQNGNGGYCFKIDKYGFFAGGGIWKGKDFHISQVSPLPPHKIKGISSFGTKIEIYNVTFENFRPLTRLGMRQRIFEFHSSHPDYIPMHEFYDTKFVNCEHDALAFWWEPPQKWAIIKDCGEWPCTGPKNTLYSFQRTTFEGQLPSYAATDFTIIPNTLDFSKHVQNCQLQGAMNAWTCQQTRLGILLFDSEDPDTLDRSVQPVYSRLQGTDMNNKINSFMDHVWDGFYTGQTRLTRFPILVYLPQNSVYDIVYTGTPPKRQKYTLRSQDTTTELIVRIAYPGAESRQILKDGKRVEMNEWDEAERGYGPIQRRFCGENRFIGVKNILEFYLTAGCLLQIAPRDAIQTMVRMEWSVDEFFSNGGTTQFVDRVAGSLGIHASTIKVVSVYEGSLVVNYDIVIEEPATNDTNTTDGSTNTSTSSVDDALAAIKAKQIEAFSTGSIDLGAPISDVELTVIKNEPVAEVEDRTEGTNTTNSTNSTDSNTTSDSSSSTNSSSESQKIISGGQVTAPGYPPVIFNMDAYFKPQLLRNKDNGEYDEKALRLAKILANVTLASQAKQSTLHKTGTATELDPFFHVFDGGWTFWAVENRPVIDRSNAGIYLKQAVSIEDTTDRNYGSGKPLTETNVALLIDGGKNGKVWVTGGQNDPILMAYDKLNDTSSKDQLSIVQFDNLEQMKAGTISQQVDLELTNSSQSEVKPIIQSVKWNGQISNSEIEMLYEYTSQAGAVKLGLAIQSTDGTWTKHETNIDQVFSTEGFSKKFQPFHKFIYQDDTFYLAGSERLQNDVQLDQNVLLLDGDMTPLSVLPMHLPDDLRTDIIGNHTYATLKRMNEELVAVSFQHRNKTDDSYSQFLYFVDLQQFLPKERVEPKPYQPPEPEQKSVISKIVEVIIQVVVQIINFVFGW